MKLVQLTEVSDQTIPSHILSSMGRREQRFREHLEKLQRYKQEGELTATELKELKGYMNDGIDTAWTTLIRAPFYYGGKYESLPEKVRTTLDSHPQLHTIPGFLKKVKKAPDHPATQIAIEFLESLVPISHDVKGLKDKVVKKKRDVRQKEQAQETKQKSMLAHEDVKKVQAVLVQVTDNLKDELYKSNVEWLTKIVDRWYEQYQPENGKTDPRLYYRNDAFKLIMVRRATDHTGEHLQRSAGRALELKSDYKDILAKEAKQITQDMINRFVYKNTQKLAEILTKKNNLKTVQLVNAYSRTGVIEGTLKLEFRDGSSFVVNSSLVHSYSVKGTPFSRYPTNFHNVVMPDGSRMKGRASEERMKEEFV